MIESQIPAVAKFFYLTAKNPKQTHEAIYRTLIRLQKIYKTDPKQAEDPSHIVRTTNHYWKHLFKKQRSFFFQAPVKNKEFAETAVTGFVMPKDTKISIWNQFTRNCNDEELLLVTWSKVLSISEQDIARGLGLSSGTVRFRLSHALRKLGQVQ